MIKETLLRVPDSCTLEELLHKVTDKNTTDLDAEDLATASVQCSKQLNSVWLNTNIRDDVGLLVNDFGCRYIRFHILPKAVEPSPPKRVRMAMDVLMGAARSRNKLPKPKRKPEKNPKAMM